MRAVSAVVPAAGLSTRMKGPNKLLLPFGDTTVVGAVVKTLQECGLPVIVVTGRDPERIAEAVAPARTVFNPRFEEGMGTSIAVGTASAPEGNAILVALGDMPGLRSEVVKRLIEHVGDHAIVRPRYSGSQDEPGHPVLFGSAFRSDLVGLAGDDGAKSIVANNLSRLVTVDFAGSLSDIDASV